jgi:hypothetical protein
LHRTSGVVSPGYQGKHDEDGGGEAEGGRKVAMAVPPLVLLGFWRWADQSATGDQNRIDESKAAGVIIAPQIKPLEGPRTANPQ